MIVIAITVMAVIVSVKVADLNMMIGDMMTEEMIDANLAVAVARPKRIMPLSEVAVQLPLIRPWTLRSSRHGLMLRSNNNVN